MRRLPPPGPLPAVASWLEASPHAYSRAELLTVWSRWDVDSAARSGAIDRVAPAVYASPAHAAEPRVRGEAISLWNPMARVTGELALHFYAPELPAPAIADAVVPYGNHPRPPRGVRVLQRAPLVVSARPAGVPCVVAERALLDGWHVATRDRSKTMFYEALWCRATTPRAIARELARMPRLRDRHSLDALLSHFADGAHSPLEVYARTEVFVGVEWEQFVRQAPLPLPGRAYTADMLHPATKVIVEFDGRRYHANPERAERDRIRDAELASLGYVTVRLSPRDLVDRPEWCRAVVRGAIANRRLV